jgi:Domain of unknown function (DUF4169)
MADIINLRMARKAKVRADHAKAGAENRAKFGRSKADKALKTAQAALMAKTVEGARRET